MSNPRTSMLVTMTAVPLLLALFAGCGSDETPDVGDGPGSGGEDSVLSFDDWQLEYAACMRGKGVNIPDPSGGSMQLDDGGDPEALAAATEECREELGDPPVPEGGFEADDEQMTADMLKTAQCLRDRGYEVPDPDPETGLSLPDDVPVEALEICAPNGVRGPTAP
jgi:hypothetical protein